jgi:FkbM family methyltransferase
MRFVENIRDFTLRKIAERYLQRVSIKHENKFPRLAIFSFDYIGNQINLYGRFELQELNKLSELLTKFEVALDIGANIGNHSTFFAGIFKKVYAFEPNITIIPILKYNTRKFRNVLVCPFGASDTDGTVHARIPTGNVGGAHIEFNTKTENDYDVEFKLRRLDGVEEIGREDSIDFVKLDVEGHELQALRGMEKLIKHHGPLIAFEQQATEVRNGSTATVDHLRDLGYSHFYEIRSGIFRVPHSIPALLRWPLRLIEAGWADPHTFATVAEINALEDRTYAMLLASQTPIEIG